VIAASAAGSSAPTKFPRVILRRAANLFGRPGVLLPSRPARPDDRDESMIKALSAIAVAAFAAATITVLPSFAPSVEASVPRALAKADRLPIRALGPSCAGQHWPNIDAACLRPADSKASVTPVRMVSTDRR
jgi:hypothetical protein